MKKVKLVLVGAVLAVATLGSAAPSQAMMCHDSIDEACAIAARVICGVVNKGKPCLM